MVFCRSFHLKHNSGGKTAYILPETPISIWDVSSANNRAEPSITGAVYDTPGVVVRWGIVSAERCEFQARP